MVFSAGLIAGISIVGLLSFTKGPAAPVPDGGMVPVTAETAKMYVKNYLADAAPVNVKIKGFTIDKSQLEAMNAIFKENPALAGFRVYMGKDQAARRTGIVVGSDATGKDAYKNTIFSTDSQNLSICPPICDSHSPIAAE
jgi:hypothetical protein